MTSELLIANKNAIVMGADSTVTVNNIKTYNGFNKLFKLSNEPSMGIMVFGSANFEGIPLETLIKDYRKQTDFEALENIENIKDDFLNYLAKVTPNTGFNKIDSYLDNFEEMIVKQIEDFGNDVVIDNMNLCRNDTIFPFLKSDYDYGNFNERFQKILLNFKDDENMPSLDSLKKYFCYFCGFQSTGVVIAGFSKNDFFPSYISFNRVMNFENEIVICNCDSELNFESNVIIPFAQKDVITTFLIGIDKEIEELFVNYFYELVTLYFEIFLGIKGNLDNFKDILYKFINLNKSIITNFELNIFNLKNQILFPILESIGMLSKDDLVDMCKLLINITSLKKKITSDLMSVGGDIDVAVISKGDGFIWKN